MKKSPILAAIILVSLLASACTQATPAGPVTLRFVTLPILEALPLYVAQQEGLFEQYNLNVEIIPAGSAPERDQIIRAAQADGMINELLSTIFYNQSSIEVQTVRYARAATATTPLFHILASGQSGITTPEGLKGAEIGISQGTVIEYLTDRLLEAEGFSAEEINGVAVPSISDRMALLGSGSLSAAMLPDPLTYLAEEQGAVIVVDDTLLPEYSFSCMTFRKAYLDQNPAAVRDFLAAIEQAVTLINADPSNWTSLLVEQKLLPEPLAGSYIINPYPTAGVPTQAQWEDVFAWATEKGLISVSIAYADSVTDEYLP